MPPAGQTNDFEKCSKAQHYIIKGDVTARTAIMELQVTNQEDVRLIREFAARRDIDKGMPAPNAIKLNDVEDRDDDRKLRIAGAKRAVRRKQIAPDALKIHGVSHGNDIAEIYRYACSQAMEAGRSAIQAAQHHGLKQDGFIFRQMALKGAGIDLKKGMTAERALDRNGVRDESDAKKMFRSSLERRNARYLTIWSESVRANQQAAYTEKPGGSRKRKTFEPVYYQPVAAFVDLDGMGATPMITAGRTGPEIVSELEISTPSHVAEIKRRCAKRDFIGENPSGNLAGKQVSALFALRLNKVEHRDDAAYLLREEVDRETNKKFDAWAKHRTSVDRPTADIALQGHKRLSDTPIGPSGTKIRRLSVSINANANGRVPEVTYEAHLHARTDRGIRR